MTNNAIKNQSILPRIDGIQKDVFKLKKLSILPILEFSSEDNFVKAQFYLRQALEGVFHISSHILSRMPGGRATEYKNIAGKMGEMGVVDVSFAQNQLTKMAGYRNRLTHFYADITPEEVQDILKKHLADFDVFLIAIKQVLEHPEKFSLTIE